MQKLDKTINKIRKLDKTMYKIKQLERTINKVELFIMYLYIKSLVI